MIRYASCTQSIDRVALAEKLQRRLSKEDKTIDILIQVNTSYGQSKFGVVPNEALNLAFEIKRMENIRIKGLMAIGLLSANHEKVRKCYRLLKIIQQTLQDKGIAAAELLMRRSGDLEIAIVKGSTMVRTGTAIFGERQYPDRYYRNEDT